MTDLPSLRSEIQYRLALHARIGHHSTLAGLALRVQRHLAALDVGDHVMANAELACLRYLVGDTEAPPTVSRWRRSLRTLIIAALLVSATVSIVALRLRATDAEMQLEMCRRGLAAPRGGVSVTRGDVGQ